VSSPEPISKPPFPNEIPPLQEEFKRLQAGKFTDWRLSINGMVARPASFSLDQLRSYPSRSQITMVQCEEGWSYIAEWIGVPLSQVLQAVEVHPQARYVVYFSIDPEWWDSIDMADALHPQTFLTYGMNGGALPVGNGGSFARVPTQLQEREIHYSPDGNRQSESFGKGLGSAFRRRLCWYAGI
jgi:DMSO/TMAO reductase YedYZ molybdopterin-dependent catalytic subunit